MRALLLICAGLVLIAGGVSTTLWHKLRTQQQLTSDLQKQLSEANDRIQELAAQRRGAQQPSTAPLAISPSDARTSAAPSLASNPPIADAASELSLKEYRARENEMMKDPDYRKARIAQRRTYMQSIHPGLAEELGLSQKETDRLFDLLSEQEDTMQDRMQALYEDGRPLDQAKRDDITQKQIALSREQDEQVSALLGPGQYAQWLEYGKSRIGRMQAIQLGKHMAEVGQPLSDFQRNALTSVLISEQNRLMQQMQPLLRNADSVDPRVQMQLQEQTLKLEEESNRRVLDAAAASLSSRQIANVKQYYQMQSDRNTAQLRIAQRSLEAQRSGQASQ